MSIIGTQCDTIPGIKNQLNELKEEVNSFQVVANEFPFLQAKVANLEEKLEVIQSSNSLSGLNGERMIDEVQERIAKSKNLLLHNVPESNDSVADATSAINILAPINVNLTSISATRVGNPGTKPRPSLITMASQQDVLKIEVKLRKPIKHHLIKPECNKTNTKLLQVSYQKESRMVRRI
ncbi:hypothetical protein QAD02_017422 [Eretmocerus hayati]|uniref:Uncharacterized protein n=1 Tax=Eretmocerus hayati TaxID=131215 RepID=A0ACC2PIM7_9HYME|nr:hypothetical protein QAD02_017422 [Eretmocerus hayati]